MSNFIDILETEDVDYSGILTDVCKNLCGKMFKDTTLEYRRICGSHDTEYMLLNTEDIEVFYNGISGVLTDENIDLSAGLSSELVPSVETDNLTFAKFGNKLILDNNDVIVLLRRIRKSRSYLEAGLYNAFIEMIFYLFIRDTVGVYRALNNLSKVYSNTLGENKQQGITKTIKSGRIVPMSL